MQQTISGGRQVAYIGVDLGGTKIEVVAVDDYGHELVRHRIPTPQGDYDGILRAIFGLVAAVEKKLATRTSVGIGTPGALSSSGLMKNANSTCLIGRPLLADLQRILGRPIRMANDANCFALSEAIDGSGQGAHVIFGVILGTGVGGGIVADGHVLQGRNAIAGEWGHNPLPWPDNTERPGPPCYCGKEGCIETYLSGPAVARDHLATSDKTLTPEVIVTRAESGDNECARTLARYEDRLARSLAHVINILDPDVIVLGGGMSNIGRLYENVPRLWSRYVFSDEVTTLLLPARHGDSSGVRGAAWLWKG
jgi:fructokinase